MRPQITRSLDGSQWKEGGTSINRDYLRGSAFWGCGSGFFDGDGWD
jgi:hypothetical protein